MERCFMFQWVVFQMGGFIFKWEVCPIEGPSVLMGGGFEKNLRMGDSPSMGNPEWFIDKDAIKTLTSSSSEQTSLKSTGAVFAMILIQILQLKIFLKL